METSYIELELATCLSLATSSCGSTTHCHISSSLLVLVAGESQFHKRAERELAVRKVTGMLTHDQLKRERQRRGWSREYVAEQIGIADPKTIGRWERGVAFPDRNRHPQIFRRLSFDSSRQ